MRGGWQTFLIFKTPGNGTHTSRCKRYPNETFGGYE